MLAAAACCVAALLPFLTGCSPRPLGRTLPRSVHTVYVPLFDSKAFESGLEELVTQYTVDRFLVDGRVKPVSRRAADLIISGTLLRWDETVSQLSNDDFELVREVEVTARVVAYAPEDTLKQDPVYVWEVVRVSGSFLVDPRFIGEVSPDDSKRILMEDLAKQIVSTVMETPPAIDAIGELEKDKVQDTGPRHTPMESLRERRYRQRGQAPLRLPY
jgi:hypothetical protein